MTFRSITLLVLSSIAAWSVLVYSGSKSAAAEESAAIASLPARVGVVVAAHAQGRQMSPRVPQTRRGIRRSSPRVRRAANSFGEFTHTSPTHRSVSCASCHKIESVVRIDVTEYPDHDACVSCHRQQFFNGARPAICTICHTVVSPRDGSRFRFPKPATPSQFAGIFPHDKHQYVIAEVAPAHRRSSTEQFVRASFDINADEKTATTQTLESCATCHVTDRTERSAPEGWMEKTPTAGTFKTSPQGHAACFTCHFQAQEPIATNCAGCHGLALKGEGRKAKGGSFKTESAISGVESRTSNLNAGMFTSAHGASQSARLGVAVAHNMDAWTERVSAKFRHERDGHDAYGCTTCHTNILDATSLRDLAAEVPIATCSACHASTSKDIQKEMDKVKADAAYTCTYCHLAGVGSRDVPQSHYAVLGRAPLPTRAERLKSKQ